MCAIQVVVKESLSWEKKLYLSVWFQINLILDIQSQHYELGHGVQRLKCLRYSISSENEFSFSFVIF